MIKFLGHLVSEKPTSTSGTHLPGLNSFRVGPHKVAEGSIMWDFDLSFNGSDMVHGLDIRRKSSMNAKDFALNDGGKSEIIEDVGAVLPRVGVSVLADDFIEETVHKSDLAGLVVASKKGDMAWEFELQAEEKLECLDGVVASVDEVADEDVAGVRNFPTGAEEFEEIGELTVNVATDGNWSGDRLDVGFFDEDLLDFLADHAEVTFGEALAVF